MRIVFRVDASLNIGTGHVMRCLTLANELTVRGAKCYFICREHKGNLIELIAQKGHDTYSLKIKISNNSNKQSDREPVLFHSTWLGSTQEEDAKQVLDIIGSIQPNWLVVDHYALDSYWEEKLKTHCNNILVIDDLADREHDCDVLLDQNFLPDFENRYNNLVSNTTTQLLGPSYTLLKNEYSEMRNLNKQSEYFKIPQILVNFGGIGDFQLLSNFIAAANDNPQFNYLIITGAVEPKHFQELNKLIAGNHITLSSYTSEMPSLMYQSQFAVGACGSTVWERFCLGLNSALVEMADNQHPLISYLQDEDLIDSLGHKNNLSSTKISRFLSNLNINSPIYTKRKVKIMSLVDGLGTQRISNVMFKF